MPAGSKIIRGLFGKGIDALTETDIGALKNLQGSTSVLLGERETPLPLSDFLKMLPDDIDLTAKSVAREINRLPDDLSDIKFNLLMELDQRFPEKPAFVIEDPDSTFPTYNFTQSAPAGSDQIKGFMSMVDMVHTPTGTRIPADTIIRGHEPDFKRAEGIPALDEETAQRLLMGDTDIDTARKELVRKNLKGVE